MTKDEAREILIKDLMKEPSDIYVDRFVEKVNDCFIFECKFNKGKDSTFIAVFEKDGMVVSVPQ